MNSSGRTFSVEYETVGESQGPSRVTKTDAVVDLGHIILDGNPKLHPGSRIVVRITVAKPEIESFVGVAVVEMASKGYVTARWNLLDTDRAQLEEILQAQEEAAA